MWCSNLQNLIKILSLNFQVTINGKTPISAMEQVFNINKDNFTSDTKCMLASFFCCFFFHFHNQNNKNELVLLTALLMSGVFSNASSPTLPNQLGALQFNIILTLSTWS